VTRGHLVVGGTGFLGSSTVHALVAMGQRVDIVHRGRRRAPRDAPTRARQLVVDRRTCSRSDFDEAGPWTSVIDLCCDDECELARMVTALRGRTGRYVLCSTCGVYKPAPPLPLDEGHETIRYAPSGGGGRAWSKLRAEAELLSFAGRLGIEPIVVRLGVLIGPGDGSGRLPYWIGRVRRGGRIAVPMRPDQPLQLLDVRDAALLLARVAVNGGRSILNAAGPSASGHSDGPDGMSAAALMAAVVECHAEGYVKLEWLSPEAAAEHGVLPWRDIPLSLATGAPELHLMHIDSRLAVSAGLAYRSLHDSVRDCTPDAGDGSRLAGAEPRLLGGNRAWGDEKRVRL
jgi:2'-hydroxyisoflavone reductase